MTSPRSYLSSLEQIGIKLGLEQISALTRRLGSPHEAFPSILVAGTNGKGSVTAMVERGLRAAGYRTGRYTSPHLVRIEERIAVNGVDVSATAFDESVDRVRLAGTALAHPPSFFEATTAVALDVFARQAVDIAVLEVGMGGRLDATNVVDGVAAAITLVDLDHQQYLGTTLEAIAHEKAGIIKPGMLVVLGENPPAVDLVVAETCAAAGAPMVRATSAVTASTKMHDGHAVVDLTTPRRQYSGLRLALAGAHQVSNALTGVRLLEEATAAGIVRVSEIDVRSAVEQVTWPARLELLHHGDAPVLIDGAHNPAGARALARHVSATYGRRLPFLIGIMRDKAIDQIVAALAEAASHFVCVAVTHERAASPAELMAVARAVAPHVPAVVEAAPLDGLNRAITFGSPVVVAGSLYLAGEIRPILA